MTCPTGETAIMSGSCRASGWSFSGISQMRAGNAPEVWAFDADMRDFGALTVKMPDWNGTDRRCNIAAIRTSVSAAKRVVLRSISSDPTGPKHQYGGRVIKRKTDADLARRRAPRYALCMCEHSATGHLVTGLQKQTICAVASRMESAARLRPSTVAIEGSVER